MSNNKQIKSLSSMVTMKDIAEELKIDRTTVSKVLNGHSGLSEKTRKQVLETAERLGYRKDVFASGLMTRKNKILGMVVSDLSRGLFSPVVKQFQLEAKKHDYGVILCSLDSDDQHESNLEQLALLKLQRVSGVTFISNGSTKIDEDYIKAYLDDGIAFNSLELSVPIDTVDQMYFNHCKAGEELTEYLLSLGHRKIAFLTYSPSLQAYQSTRDRMQGYVNAMEKAGLKPVTFLEENSYSESYGHEVHIAYELLRRQWNKDDALTAIIGANDSFAIGILHALKDIGYHVPNDVSVAGFDDLYAEMGVPSITSMKMPVGAAGEMAAKLLVEKINQKKQQRQPQKIWLDYTMVARESIAPIQSDK